MCHTCRSTLTIRLRPQKLFPPPAPPAPPASRHRRSHRFHSRHQHPLPLLRLPARDYAIGRLVDMEVRRISTYQRRNDTYIQ